VNTSVNVHLHIPVSNLGQLKIALDALKEYSLLVGVPADEDRTSAEGKTARDDSVINNAALAYIHNNGCPAQNIPARPTLEPGIEDAKDKIAGRFEDGAKGALDGRKSAVLDNMTAAGLEAVTAVKMRIRSNTPPPLKDATLAARRRRGHTSTQTLIETGAYLNSHSFVIKKNGG
jgi:hypothetical protein